MPGVGPHGQGVPYPNVHFKPAWGEWRECSPFCSWWQLPKATISPYHSHPDPGPRPANMKAARQIDKWEVTPVIPFLNPELITHLMGQSNEAPVIIDGQEVIMLIDLGALVSRISWGFCKQMALKVHPLDRLLTLEGTSRATMPHVGYVEVSLQISRFKGLQWGCHATDHTSHNLC